MLDVDSLVAQLQQVPSKETSTADEKKLKECASVITGALQKRFSSEFPNVLFSSNYLANFKKWHIRIGSKYFCNDEFTMIVLSIENSCVLIEFPYYEDWEQLRKIVPFAELDAKIGHILRNCISDRSFISQLELYERISNAPYFSLTVFSHDIFEYSADDLRIKLLPNEVEMLKAGKKVKISDLKNRILMCGKQDIAKEYNEKYAVVNEIC